MTSEDLRQKHFKLIQTMVIQVSTIIVLICALKHKCRRTQIPTRTIEDREKVKRELMKHIIGSERCYDIIRMGPVLVKK
jgi:hypothetical protein